MEDCCVICAEPLEWIAYGACDHKDVCSSCIARLRFVMKDNKCCICKQDCPAVFVTKALGEYTASVDFAALPARDKTKGGDLWYDDLLNAYFDDQEHFKTIKALCRLSCSVCVQAGESGKPLPRGYVQPDTVFRDIDQLKQHLFGIHKLVMCELCLEGRKVFLSEQHLYTRQQLERHQVRSCPEVDGNAEERGGFQGHPICKFCNRRLYGEAELYQHMNGEHYTCHLCQRARPDVFEYYRDYPDLENHFRITHSLCEHPDCLQKKFVVFVSESELKRHNAQTHGGNMSRSQRREALQIPINIQYSRPGRGESEREPGRQRGRLPPENRGNVRVLEAAQEQAAIRNSQETNMIEVATRESAAMAESQMQNMRLERSPSGGEQFPGLAGGGAAQSAALNVGRWGGLHPTATNDPEYFPPLPGASRHQRKKQAAQRRMTEVLGGGGSIQVLHSASGGGGQQTNYPPLGGAGPSAAPAAPAGDREAIKAANRQLVEKIKSGLGGNQILFTEFKQRSAQWQAGTLSTGQYYRYIVGVGLEDIVPQLAQTCPDPQKARELQSLQTAAEGERPLSRPGSAERNGRGKTVAEVAASDPSIKARARQAAADGFWPAATGGVNYSRGGGPSPSGGASSSQGVLPKPYAPPGFGRGSGGAGQSGILGPGAPASSAENGTGSKREGAESSLAGGPFAGGAFGRAASVDDLASVARPSVTSSVPRVSSAGSIGGSVDTSHLRDALAGAPQTWEDDGWSCSVCTLRNKAGDTRCIACGAFWLADKKDEDGAAKADEGKQKKKKTGKFQRLRLGDGSIADWAESAANGGAGPSAWGGGVGRGSAVGPQPQPDPGRKAFGRGAWGRGGGKRIIEDVEQHNTALAAHLRR